MTIRTIDITICNAVKEYLTETYSSKDKLLDLLSTIEIPIEKLDFITKTKRSNKKPIPWVRSFSLP